MLVKRVKKEIYRLLRYDNIVMDAQKVEIVELPYVIPEKINKGEIQALLMNDHSPEDAVISMVFRGDRFFMRTVYQYVTYIPEFYGSRFKNFEYRRKRISMVKKKIMYYSV